MHNYQELKVWKKAVDLATRMYEITNEFPNKEAYGLTSQIRRSAISIASNIAEGAGRNSNKDFNKFLGISYGSSCELDTQVIIAFKVNLIDETKLKSIQKDILEIQKMNWSLKKSLH